MSISVQFILGEARRLSGKLRDSESLADTLINEAQDMLCKVTAMKEYQEEITELNIMAHHRPHAALVSSIQQENRLLRELQAENRDLKAALEDYHSALEHIMSKYRQHMSIKLDKLKDIDITTRASNDEELTKRQAEKIQEMANVMRKAAELDDANTPQVLEMLSRLTVENETLKELLQLSRPEENGRQAKMNVQYDASSRQLISRFQES